MLTIKTYNDIFRMPDGADEALCVTTNGIVKSDGHAVMGAGIAKQADQLFHCSERLGALLRQFGNKTFDMGTVHAYGHAYRLFTFPTKHHWRNNSDQNLIIDSARELVRLCDQLNIKTCYLPPAGCGLGGLNWEKQIKPILSNILDDRFIVVLRP